MELSALGHCSEQFRALSHPVRLKILAILEDENMSVSGMVQKIGIPQPVLSQHLASLKNKGIIGYRSSGSRHIYFIKEDNVCGILRCIENVHTRDRT